jgi:hypothetical protein
VKIHRWTLVASAIAGAFLGTTTQAQVKASAIPEGRLYAVHTKAMGGCPALDWHVVARPGGVLEGFVGWNDMKSIAKVSGTAMGGGELIPFHMNAVELGGQARTASIYGSITPDGWLKVNIIGPEVSCQNVRVPFINQKGGGAGG